MSSLRSAASYCNFLVKNVHFQPVVINRNSIGCVSFLVREFHQNHKRFDGDFDIQLWTHQHRNTSRVSTISTNSIPITTTNNKQQPVYPVDELQRKLLPDNIRFHYCPNDERVATGPGTTSKRPLLLLFGWLLSQDKNLNKYRKFWFDRGFDVLSFRTYPWQLLLPYFGGRVNALKAYSYMSTQLSEYDEILIHAFSVGGYQLGELVQVLHNNKDTDERARKMFDAIKGIIIDSCVFTEDAAPGVSRAITLNPIMQPILQMLMTIFLTTTKPFIAKRLLHIQKYLVDNERGLPGLILCSKTDVVSSIPLNEDMYQKWCKKTNIVHMKCWDESPHVLHFKHHKEEYIQLVDDFVKRIQITKSKKPT